MNDMKLRVRMRFLWAFFGILVTGQLGPPLGRSRRAELLIFFIIVVARRCQRQSHWQQPRSCSAINESCFVCSIKLVCGRKLKRLLFFISSVAYTLPEQRMVETRMASRKAKRIVITSALVAVLVVSAALLVVRLRPEAAIT